MLIFVDKVTSIMEELQTENISQEKRRPRNKSEWKREKRKRSIIAGESHYNVRGEYISEKQIGTDCKCKLKCFDKIDSKTRQTLFEGFYNLKSYDEQNAYLFGLIRRHDVKRKKNIQSDRRTCTYKYYIRNQGKEMQVCKLAFAHIHAISFRKIRTLSEKLDQNVLFPRDGRGKHDNRPTKTPQETVDTIKKHIFNILKSDDLRMFIKEDKSRYLSPELNVAKLYINFLQVHEQDAVNPLTGLLKPGYSPKVKSWLYRKVFQEEIKYISHILKRAVEVAHDSLQCVQGLCQADNALKNKAPGETGSCPKGSNTAVVEVSKIPQYITQETDSSLQMSIIHTTECMDHSVLSNSTNQEVLENLLPVYNEIDRDVSLQQIKHIHLDNRYTIDAEIFNITDDHFTTDMSLCSDFSTLCT